MAQLGARFHGMEEVDGSNPSRSTKTFQTLTVFFDAKCVAAGVQLESKLSILENFAARARAAVDWSRDLRQRTQRYERITDSASNVAEQFAFFAIC